MERLRFPFDVLSWDYIPKDIIDQARKIRTAGGYILTSHTGIRYGLISAGALPNPGYRLHIIKVEDGLRGPVVTVRITPPNPHDVFIQVIAYPYIIGAIAQDTEVIIVNGLPKNALSTI